MFECLYLFLVLFKSAITWLINIAKFFQRGNIWHLDITSTLTSMQTVESLSRACLTCGSIVHGSLLRTLYMGVAIIFYLFFKVFDGIVEPLVIFTCCIDSWNVGHGFRCSAFVLCQIEKQWFFAGYAIRTVPHGCAIWTSFHGICIIFVLLF